MSNYTDTEVLDADVEGIESDGSTKAGDIAEGGIIGAIGGGIVGALAGGPVGAVIGAVLGAGASGVAIDVLDKHDDEDISRGGTHPLGATPVITEVYGITSPTSVDIEQIIRLEAYDLWEQRGHRIGFDLEDWFDAYDNYRQRTAIFSS